MHYEVLSSRKMSIKVGLYSKAVYEFYIIYSSVQVQVYIHNAYIIVIVLNMYSIGRKYKIWIYPWFLFAPEQMCF